MFNRLLDNNFENTAQETSSLLSLLSLYSLRVPQLIVYQCNVKATPYKVGVNSLQSWGQLPTKLGSTPYKVGVN